MKTAIVAYQNCTSSMLTGMMDILSLANSMTEDNASDEFDITIISEDGKPVKSFNGFPIPAAQSIRSKKVYDIIYVPGFLADALPTISQTKPIVKWLRGQHESGATVAGACNGNLLVAETGILNGKRATTHWSLAEFFSKRYPKVNFQPEQILIDEGDVLSAAGVTAYMNLALHIISRYVSPDVAAYCSKVFLIDSGRRLQSPYMIYTTPRSHGDNEIVKVQNWLEKNYTTAVSIDSVIDESALGKRTLLRRFKKATGDTPIEYLQRIRLENAKRILETTNKTFSEITWQVGYNDTSSFQRLFKSYTKLTPKEYRNKFMLVD
jgi:transcriptional regulator GlxA family with amidase domain